MFSVIQRFLKEKQLANKYETNSEVESMVVDKSSDEGNENHQNGNQPKDDLILYGTISDIYDDGYIINVHEHDRFESVQNTKSSIKFLVNDKVKLLCFVEEEEFGSLPKFSVNLIEPSSKSDEFGKVSMIHEKFVEFDGRVVMIKSSSDSEDQKFQLGQEFKYAKIETYQEIDRFVWHWRVVKFLPFSENHQKVATSKPNISDSKTGIVVQSPNLTFHKSSKDVHRKYIKIENRLNEKVELLSADFSSPTSELIDVDQRNLKFVFHPLKGSYKVYYRIFPRQAGIFELNFIVNCKTSKGQNIEEILKFQIEVVETKNCILKAPQVTPIERFPEIEIQYYHVPQDLRKIDLKRVSFGLAQLSEAFPLLSEKEINPENYLDKLHYGIYLEEMAMEQAFAAYQVKEGIFEEIGGFLKLQVKEVAEKRPSIIAGDFVDAKPVSTNSNPLEEKSVMIARGRIQRVEQDAVLIDFDASFRRTHNSKKYLVNFYFSRTPYRYEHHAIDKVHQKFGFDFIFPSNSKPKHPQFYAKLSEDEKLIIQDKERGWFDKQLNKRQKEAVVNVLNGEFRPFPYIVYGPPGTGKTKTIIEIITQISSLDPKAHIIIATPSNSAANIFTQAFVKSNQFDKSHDFVRFVSNNQIERGLIPDSLEKYCATIRAGREDGDEIIEPKYNKSGLRLDCTKTTIMNYRICIGTLHCLGSLMKIKFPEDHFKYVILDEAGQATEAETFEPIASLSKDFGQVILAGDPLQLGPISHSTFVKNLNLNFSFLDRLIYENECYAVNDQGEYDSKFATKLDINYRSTPTVLSIYNDLFYDGKLIGNIKETSPEAELPSVLNFDQILWPNPDKNENYGVYFIDVAKGKNRKIPESCSWYNDAEISLIISFLNKLTCNDSGMKYSFKDLGIITPYALQARKLREKISNFSDTDLKVGTVEDFQGQERKIILLSTVRTQDLAKIDLRHTLGFLQCPKRINVALSRARSLLVIFGKAALLQNDENWNKVINLTKQNGTFVVDDRT